MMLFPFFEEVLFNQNFRRFMGSDRLTTESINADSSYGLQGQAVVTFASFVFSCFLLLAIGIVGPIRFEDAFISDTDWRGYFCLDMVLLC